MDWAPKSRKWRGRLDECEDLVDGVCSLKGYSESGEDEERWLSHNLEGRRDRKR